MYDQAGSCSSALTSPHPFHQWPLLLQLPGSSFTSKAMLKSPEICGRVACSNEFVLPSNTKEEDEAS